MSTLFDISGTDLVPVHICGSMLNGPVPVLDRPNKVTKRADSDAMIAAMGTAIRSKSAAWCRGL